MLKSWTFKEKFDLINICMTMGAFTPRQWERVYKQAYMYVISLSDFTGLHSDQKITISHLMTGYEQFEPRIGFRSDDGTFPADAVLAGWADGEPEPWTSEQVQVFFANVRKELASGWHIYWNFGRVWAQKLLLLDDKPAAGHTVETAA